MDNTRKVEYLFHSWKKKKNSNRLNRGLLKGNCYYIITVSRTFSNCTKFFWKKYKYIFYCKTKSWHLGSSYLTGESQLLVAKKKTIKVSIKESQQSQIFQMEYLSMPTTVRLQASTWLSPSARTLILSSHKSWKRDFLYQLGKKTLPVFFYCHYSSVIHCSTFFSFFCIPCQACNRAKRNEVLKEEKNNN